MSNLTTSTQLSFHQTYPLPICSLSEDSTELVEENCASLFGGGDDDFSHDSFTNVNFEEKDSENLVGLGYVELMNLLFGDNGVNTPATSAFNFALPLSPQVGGLESNTSQLSAPATQFNPVQSETYNSSLVCALSDQVDFEHSAYSIFEGNNDTFEQAIGKLTENPVQPAHVPNSSLGIDISSAPATDLQGLKWPPMPPTEEQDRDAYIEIIHQCVFQLGIWDEEHPLFQQDLHKDGSVKRPINDFPLYRRVWDATIRLQLKEEHQPHEITTGLVSKVIGRKWRSLSDHSKKCYKDLANKHLERFKAKYPGYVFDGAGSRAKRGLPPKKSPTNNSPSRSVRETRRAGSVSSNDSVNTPVQNVPVYNIPREYLQPQWQQPEMFYPPYGYNTLQMLPLQPADLQTLMGQLHSPFQYPQVQLPQFPVPLLDPYQFPA